MKNALGTKIYYSISEVADITDLQPYTLRAWEKEFSCLRPRRARGKNRAYRERDIGIVQLIKQLLYEEGYTTKGVKQKLKNEPELLQITTFVPPQVDANKPDQRCEVDAQQPTQSRADTGAEAGADREEGARSSDTPSTAGADGQMQRVLAEVRSELQAILEKL